MWADGFGRPFLLRPSFLPPPPSAGIPPGLRGDGRASGPGPCGELLCPVGLCGACPSGAWSLRAPGDVSTPPVPEGLEP